jgi:hypothetical protein
MNSEEYKYDVAFSFLKQDEPIAYSLNDQIQDRYSTFIYSKHQEELGGTDGEKQFNNVFFEECRIVVLLYRDGWGQTPWTRIEETAIKNRAFGKGWHFLLVINLDTMSMLPTWIPKTYIWVDFQRFKSEGAVAVIDHKIKEEGGQNKPDTIENRVERLKRLRNAEKMREEFLVGNEVVATANKEIKYLIDKLKLTKPTIEDPLTDLYLNTEERLYPPMYEFGYKGCYLCFNNSSSFQISVRNHQLVLLGMLRVVIYEKDDFYGSNEEEIIIKQVDLKFDRNLLGQNGWADYNTGDGFVVSDELLDKWVSNFLEVIGNRN